MSDSDDLFARPAAKAPTRTRAQTVPAMASDYTAAHIEVLEGLEPVRRRPGMYIGGTDAKALHHLFAEVIDNSMDEAVAGHASFIEVQLGKDGFLTVTDNGRGIPVEPHPKFPKKSTVEVIMTTLHAGGKFDSKVYETSGGLHGVGVSVVNALSDLLEVEVARNQTLYRQTFSKGLPKGGLTEVGRARPTGAAPASASILIRKSSVPPRSSSPPACSAWRVPRPICSAAWKCAGPAIRSCSPASPACRKDDLPLPGGLKDYLAADIEGQTLVHPDIFAGRIQKQGGHGSVEWAVAWVADADGGISSYCKHHPDAGRRHPRERPTPRPAQGPARIWRAHRPGQTLRAADR